LTTLPDPEIVSSELLKRTDQSVPPVDLDSVLRLWGDLRISIQPLAREGYFLDLGVMGGELLVNSRDPRTRRRYTIAHELGHWMLKQLTGSSQHRRNLAPDQQSERWCHEFASALLMPSSWLIEDLRKNRLSGLPDSVLLLPKIYDVSSDALGIRISSVTPVSIVEVSTDNGHVIVGKRFQSKRVAEELVAGTIKRISSQLPLASAPRQHYCAETQLMSVSKRVRKDVYGSCWLVCVLPKSED
jgi:hypothetical protein